MPSPNKQWTNQTSTTGVCLLLDLQASTKGDHHLRNAPCKDVANVGALLSAKASNSTGSVSNRPLQRACITCICTLLERLRLGNPGRSKSFCDSSLMSGSSWTWVR